MLHKAEGGVVYMLQVGEVQRVSEHGLAVGRRTHRMHETGCKVVRLPPLCEAHAHGVAQPPDLGSVWYGYDRADG